MNSANNPNDIEFDYNFDSNQSRKRKRFEYEDREESDESLFADCSESESGTTVQCTLDEYMDYIYSDHWDRVAEIDTRFENYLDSVYEPPHKRHKRRNGAVLDIEQELDNIERFKAKYAKKKNEEIYIKTIF